MPKTRCVRTVEWQPRSQCSFSPFLTSQSMPPDGGSDALPVLAIPPNNPNATGRWGPLNPLSMQRQKRDKSWKCDVFRPGAHPPSLHSLYHGTRHICAHLGPCICGFTFAFPLTAHLPGALFFSRSCGRCDSSCSRRIRDWASALLQGMSRLARAPSCAIALYRRYPSSLYAEFL